MDEKSKHFTRDTINMQTFEKTTLIDCSAKELFDFHLDTNNIKLITPKHTKVELKD